MTAAEYGRPDRWPDAMERWLPHGAAEPGSAAMPSAYLLQRVRALPAACLSVVSHAEVITAGHDPRLPETRSGDLA